MLMIVIGMRYVMLFPSLLQEHADKTITLESHPHLATFNLATIHPCRHAAVMKRLIEQFQENGKELVVLDYLFIFLKFVQVLLILQFLFIFFKYGSGCNSNRRI
jgi:hypothetical protein